MITVVVQIPALNEAGTLESVISEIPRKLPGVDKVLILVIDDGSTDNTSEIATKAGADRVFRHNTNLGLARAYTTGLKQALDMGADIIVNTDADNQYQGSCIAEIVSPLLLNEADVAIGARPISEIDSFSPLKKFLQRMGTGVVRIITGLDLDDAPSGFRAITRETAQSIVVYTCYTYTLETLVQMGVNGYRVISVPIAVNPESRPSRLVKNNFVYIVRSLVTMIRVLMIYRSFRILGVSGAILLGLGTLIGLRYIYLLVLNPDAGHVQSLVLGAILILAGIMFTLVGFLGELLAANRKLLEELRYKSNLSGDGNRIKSD